MNEMSKTASLRTKKSPWEYVAVKTVDGKQELITSDPCLILARNDADARQKATVALANSGRMEVDDDVEVTVRPFGE